MDLILIDTWHAAGAVVVVFADCLHDSKPTRTKALPSLTCGVN
jgi:hypothetical protein